MISFREYLQEELSSTSMILYGRCDKEKLDSILKFDYKNLSHVHFYKYDDGIYCFSDLKSALNPEAARRYGKYILKFTIPGGTKNFFYTSYKAYKQAVNPNAEDGEYTDNVPFIDEQIKRFGLSKKELLKNGIYPTSQYKYKQCLKYQGVEDFQGFVRYLEKYGLIPNSIKGIEYYSKEDKNSFIVFDNKAIVPLEVLDTNGNLIEKINKQIKETGYKNSRKNLSTRKIQRSDFNHKFIPNRWGNINCHFEELTSLWGAPPKVIGHFDCHLNNLTSLQGAPREVDKDFDCRDNKLTSLQGAPRRVGGDFYCDSNQLVSLQGAPKEVGGDFYCEDNSKLPKKEIIKYSKECPNITIHSDYGDFKGGVEQ